MRGIRGATTVEEDTRESILDATEELLQQMIKDNSLQVDDIASVLFTMTPDLHAVFPAEAARKINWTEVPLICAQELEINGAMSKCIRVLIHWNTPLLASQVKHCYLRKAKALRPDLEKRDSNNTP